jgi:hypothetical protein
MKGPAFALAVSTLAAACGAVFPELSTPERPAAPGQRLDPEPPAELLFVTFQSAEIPERTRDGRSWNEVGGDAPDPFAKLVVDDQDILVTPVAENTLQPRWPNQARANYRILPSSRVRVELWDSNPINNHPICVQSVENLRSDARGGTIEVICDSGARLELRVERARAQLGLGLRYELQNDAAYITAVAPESPAARAGLRHGDQIVAIQGHAVDGMEAGQARTLVNAHARRGLRLRLKRGAKVQDIRLKEGPIYRTWQDQSSTH